MSQFTAQLRVLTRLACLIGVGVLLAGCPGVQTVSNASPNGIGGGATTTATTPATTGMATLSWAAPALNTDGTIANDLVGYHIHYGTSAAALALTIDVSGARTTTYTITGLTAGTYYFAVNAYNSLGVEGLTSGTVSKTL